MSFELGEAFVRVRPEVDERAVDRVSKTTAGRVAAGLDKYGKKVADAGDRMTLGVTVPIIGAGAATVKLASDMTEMEDRTRDVFGKSSGHVIRWSDTMLDRYGVGKDEALDFANVVGNSMIAADLPMNKVLKTQDKAVKRIGDLASATNASSDEIVDAYSAMLRGEYDPMERFVPGISAATVEQKAMAMGLVDANGEVTRQGKIMAAHKLFMEGSANASGNFARTQDSAANQTRLMKENAEVLGRELGTHLLPMVTKVLKGVTRWIKRFGELDEGTQKTILAVAGVVAAVGPLLSVMGRVAQGLGVLVKLFPVVGKAFLALSKILLSNPWILIATAVIALAVVIYKNWDKITAFLKKTWKTITRGIEAFGKWWSKFWRATLDKLVDLVLDWTLVGRIIKHWDAIEDFTKDLLKWLVKAWKDFVDWLLKWVTKNWKALTTLWSKTWDLLERGVKGFLKWLRSIWDSAVDFVLSVVKKGWSNLTGNTRNLIDTFQRIWKNFSNWITERWDKTWDNVKRGIDNVRRNIGGWVDKVVSGARSAWSKIQGAFKSPINAVISFVNNGPIKAWNWVASKLGWRQAGQIPRLAKGGPLHRYGSGTGDKILGLLDPREFVVPPEMVKAIGLGNLERMRRATLRGKAIQLDGPMGASTWGAFAEGGLAGGQRVAKRMHGTPYIWGGAGWGGADCSGFMSMIINGINGKAGPGRLFATGSHSMLDNRHGMKRGSSKDSLFEIGVSPPGGMTGRIGHTYGRLGKVNVESGGGHGPAYGPPSGGGWRGYPIKYHHGKSASPLAGLMNFLGFIPNFLTRLAGFRERGPLYNLFGGIPARAIRGVKAKARAIVSKPVEWITGTLKRIGSFIFDDGGTLAPGWNTVYNATGRPEPLVPAGQGGSSRTLVVNVHVDAARIRDMVAFMDMIESLPRVARQHGYIPKGAIR